MNIFNLADWQLYNYIELFSRLAFLLLLAPIHELAHGWMAYKQGDDTASLSGRLTLNPFAHLDPIGSVLILLTGFGWAKPVPVNPLRMKNFRKSMMYTALAGPASNLILAFLLSLASNIMWCFMSVSAKIEYNTFSIASNHKLSLEYMDKPGVTTFVLFILTVLFYLNVGLAVFNLLPIHPLDGSHILGYFTPPSFHKFMRDNAQVIQIVFLVLIFSGGGFLQKIMEPVGNLILKTTDWIPRVFG